mmetsp:Transcript_125832/g.402821  ORF Transcript_125832/g.402821 Transcript_125832/m.402821 type:complete len:112 (-) Transcript_125832:217-552(-)
MRRRHGEVKQLAGQLPCRSGVKGLRVSLIDREEDPDIGTILYREAEDPQEDVALFFLVGRTFAVQDSTTTFLDGMKQRLVLMVHSEDAASTFQVDKRGEDFRTTNLLWSCK